MTRRPHLVVGMELILEEEEEEEAAAAAAEVEAKEGGDDKWVPFLASCERGVVVDRSEGRGKPWSCFGREGAPVSARGGERVLEDGGRTPATGRPRDVAHVGQLQADENGG